MLLIHGGGFVLGSVEGEHARAATTAIHTGAVVVSVEYRLAPEHPFPAGLHDCYSALVFLARSAGDLGVDGARVALVGSSAGGGLAAATALLARDRGGPGVCFQMLHIPELDDRLDTPSMREFVDSPMWNRPLAEQSWRAYLGAGRRPRCRLALRRPARATELSGLPPAYISTAENDPLRDEGILYGLRLLQAGVSVELHQFPGTYHGSAIAASAAVTQRAQQREHDLVAPGPGGRLSGVVRSPGVRRSACSVGDVQFRPDRGPVTVVALHSPDMGRPGNPPEAVRVTQRGGACPPSGAVGPGPSSRTPIQTRSPRSCRSTRT